MGGLIVTFGIIIGMSVLGYLTQMLKRASDRRQQERDRERERERRARAALENPNPVPTRRNDLDRFIQAVEAQRQKAVPTARPARANPVPTVPVVRKKSRREESLTTVPSAKGGKATTGAEELPMATVVSAPGATPLVAPVKVAKVAKTVLAPGTPAPTSPLGRQLLALLRTPQSPALAVVLAEVLGPPKCRQMQLPPPRQQAENPGEIKDEGAGQHK